MQLFGHLAGLITVFGEDPKPAAPQNPLVPDANLPGLPELSPPPPAMAPMGGGSSAFSVGSTVRDILSGREGQVVQGPEGDFGSVVFVSFDGVTNPMRGDQLEAVGGAESLAVPELPPMGDAPMPDLPPLPDALAPEGEPKEEVKSSLRLRASNTLEFLLAEVGGEPFDGGFTFYTGDEGHDVGYSVDGENFKIEFDALDGAHQSLSFANTQSGAKAAAEALIKELDPEYFAKHGVRGTQTISAAPGRKIANNMKQLDLPDGTQILFSYETPVAAYLPGEGYVKTEKSWSKTTSSHLSKWLPNSKNTGTVPQEFLEKIVEEGWFDNAAPAAIEGKRAIKAGPRHSLIASLGLVNRNVVPALKAMKAPTYADLLKRLGQVPKNWDAVVASVKKAGIALVATAKPKSLDGLSAYEKRVVSLCAGEPLTVKAVVMKPTSPKPKEIPPAGKTWTWDGTKQGWYQADAVTASSDDVENAREHYARKKLGDKLKGLEDEAEADAIQDFIDANEEEVDAYVRRTVKAGRIKADWDEDEEDEYFARAERPITPEEQKRMDEELRKAERGAGHPSEGRRIAQRRPLGASKVKAVVMKPTSPKPKEIPPAGKTWTWDGTKQGWYQADAVTAKKVKASIAETENHGEIENGYVLWLTPYSRDTKGGTDAWWLSDAEGYEIEAFDTEEEAREYAKTHKVEDENIGMNVKSAKVKANDDWDTEEVERWLLNDESLYHLARRSHSARQLQENVEDAMKAVPVIADNVDFDAVDWNAVFETISDDLEASLKAGSVKVSVDPNTGKKSWRNKTVEEGGNPPITSREKCPSCGNMAEGGICQNCGQDIGLGTSLHKTGKDLGAFDAAKKDAEENKGPLESIKHKKAKKPIQPYKKLDKEFKKTEVKNTAEVDLAKKD